MAIPDFLRLFFQRRIKNQRHYTNVSLKEKVKLKTTILAQEFPFEKSVDWKLNFETSKPTQGCRATAPIGQPSSAIWSSSTAWGAMTELCLAALTSFSRMAASIFPWSCCAVRMNSCSFFTKLIWCRSRANRTSCAPNVTRCLESMATQDHPMLFQFATCQRNYDDVTLKVKLRKKLAQIV